MARTLMILLDVTRQGETNALDNLRCAHGVVVAGRQQRIHAGRVYPYFAAPGTRVSAHPNHPRSTNRLVPIVRPSLFRFQTEDTRLASAPPARSVPLGRSLSFVLSDGIAHGFLADRDRTREWMGSGVLSRDRYDSYSAAVVNRYNAPRFSRVYLGLRRVSSADAKHCRGTDFDIPSANHDWREAP